MLTWTNNWSKLACDTVHNELILESEAEVYGMNIEH